MLDYYLAMTQLSPLQLCSHQDKEKGCTKVKENILQRASEGYQGNGSFEGPRFQRERKSQVVITTFGNAFLLEVFVN